LQYYYNAHVTRMIAPGHSPRGWEPGTIHRDNHVVELSATPGVPSLDQGGEPPAMEEEFTGSTRFVGAAKAGERLLSLRTALSLEIQGG
jgi:hypothetical protein